MHTPRHLASHWTINIYSQSTLMLLHIQYTSLLHPVFFIFTPLTHKIHNMVFICQLMSSLMQLYVTVIDQWDPLTSHSVVFFLFSLISSEQVTLWCVCALCVCACVTCVCFCTWQSWQRRLWRFLKWCGAAHSAPTEMHYGRGSEPGNKHVHIKSVSEIFDILKWFKLIKKSK